jgi:hypothetical protein
MSPAYDNAVKAMAMSAKNSSERAEEMDDALAARAKRARIARKPSDHPTQLIRATNPPHRIQTSPFVEQMRLSVQVGRSHAACQHAMSFHPINPLHGDHALGVYMARTQRVDADPTWPQLACHTASHLEHSRFRRVV